MYFIQTEYSSELSACDMSIFLFMDDNFSKNQIFTKLGLCIDIVEIWFGLLMGKFHQFLTVICPQHVRIFISGRYV